MSEAAASHRSDLRVEPFMDPPGAERSEMGGPLAELARLVGQEDPFRSMFRSPKAALPASGPAAREVDPYGRGFAEAETMPAGSAHAGSTEMAAHEDADGAELGLRPSYDEDDGFKSQAPHTYHASGGHPSWSHDGAALADEGFAPAGEAALDRAEPPIDSPHYVAPPLTPDLWADHDGAPEGAPAMAPPDSQASVDDAKTPRRPLVVLLAVLALTVGGLGATFLARSGSGQAVYSAGSATPTIMAPVGAVKIKQNDGTADATPEDVDVALLNTNGASSGGPVKVVSSQEQPIDLAQMPKSGTGASDTGASGGAGALMPAMTPKKVKTFLVRPDGSLVSSPPRSAAAPAGSRVPQLAVGAIASGEVGDSASGPTTAARPSSPKGLGHAATTPKSAPTSIAEAIAPTDTQPNDKPPAPSASKPTTVADAGDAAPAAGSGAFALQLAASPSEQDARAAFAKLQKKYPELAGYQATVKKVDSGQKTIYRLRVGNLGRDQAKTLCSRLEAGGGSCFVVHN